MKKIILFIAIALFIVSCSGDDNESLTPIENTVVLLRHYTIENVNSTRHYDIEYQGNRMIKTQSDDFVIQTYNYTNNVLTSINTDFATGYSYELFMEYNANGVMEKNTIFDHTGEVWRNELSYPDNISFVETSYVNHADPTVTTYTFLNGNVITGEIPNGHIEYEYDDKNAPKKNVDLVNVFKYIRFDNDGEYGNNNRTKRTTYIDNEIYETYTYEYTYDSNNYPLTKKTFHNGEYVSTITYHYE